MNNSSNNTNNNSWSSSIMTTICIQKTWYNWTKTEGLRRGKGTPDLVLVVMGWELAGKGWSAGSLGVETAEDDEEGAVAEELIREGGVAVETGLVGAEGDDIGAAEWLIGLEWEESEMEFTGTSVGGKALGRTGLVRVTMGEE